MPNVLKAHAVKLSTLQYPTPVGLRNLKQGDHYGETMLLGLEQVWRVSLVSLSSSALVREHFLILFSARRDVAFVIRLHDLKQTKGTQTNTWLQYISGHIKTE